MSERIDPEALLARVGGSRELLRKVVGLFLADSPRVVSEIRSAVTRADPDRLFRVAHKLKGSIANFSTGGAYEAARKLEGMGASRTLAGAQEALVVLEREVRDLREILGDLASDPGPAARPGRSRGGSRR